MLLALVVNHCRSDHSEKRHPYPFRQWVPFQRPLQAPPIDSNQSITDGSGGGRRESPSLAVSGQGSRHITPIAKRKAILRLCATKFCPAHLASSACGWELRYLVINHTRGVHRLRAGAASARRPNPLAPPLRRPVAPAQPADNNMRSRVWVSYQQPANRGRSISLSHLKSAASSALMLTCSTSWKSWAIRCAIISSTTSFALRGSVAENRTKRTQRENISVRLGETHCCRILDNKLGQPMVTDRAPPKH